MSNDGIYDDKSAVRACMHSNHKEFDYRQNTPLWSICLILAFFSQHVRVRCNCIACYRIH